jgi:hypothetical protein
MARRAPARNGESIEELLAERQVLRAAAGGLVGEAKVENEKKRRELTRRLLAMGDPTEEP